jgi:hypothetical protein
VLFLAATIRNRVGAKAGKPFQLSRDFCQRGEPANPIPG